jgi:dolichyl-phosphate-mannose--protein O-mannosyl transferase
MNVDYSRQWMFGICSSLYRDAEHWFALLDSDAQIALHVRYHHRTLRTHEKTSTLINSAAESKLLISNLDREL